MSSVVSPLTLNQVRQELIAIQKLHQERVDKIVKGNKLATQELIDQLNINSREIQQIYAKLRQLN